MNEKQVIGLMRQEVEAATPSGTTVRTSGGNDDLSDNLPAVILKYDTDEISSGHTPFSEHRTDSSGNETGKILKKLFQINFQLIIKSESESLKDEMGDSIQRYLIPFEEDSDLFHDESTEWNIGGVKPRNLQAVEPNWYEGFIPVSFRYTKTVETSGETLTDVNQTVNST